jgi:hypothetical protein
VIRCRTPVRLRRSFPLHPLSAVAERRTGRSLLRDLEPGSLILFASFKAAEFVLDTVFVTGEGIRHDHDSWPRVLTDLPETYADRPGPSASRAAGSPAPGRAARPRRQLRQGREGPRRRPQDQPADRCGTVCEPEDHRDPPAQHFPTRWASPHAPPSRAPSNAPAQQPARDRDRPARPSAPATVGEMAQFETARSRSGCSGVNSCWLACPRGCAMFRALGRCRFSRAGLRLSCVVQAAVQNPAGGYLEPATGLATHRHSRSVTCGTAAIGGWHRAGH